jgi:tetratricopeptide (TPR) repeat protein
LNPLCKEAWNNKGYILYKIKKKYNDAIICFDKAIEIDCYYKEAFNNRGLVLTELEKFAEAIEDFNSILKIDFNNEEAQSNKFKALLFLGDKLYFTNCYRKAFTYYKKAKKLNDSIKEIWNKLGLALFKLERYKYAIKYFDVALSLDNDYEEAWFNRGEAFSKQHIYQEAIKAYTEVLRAKSSTKVWIKKGILLFIQEDFHEANDCFDNALDLLGSLCQISRKGDTWKNKNEFKKAIKCYDDVLEIEPERFNIWLKKGIILWDIGKYEEAKKCFDKALFFSYDYEEERNTIIKILLDIGKKLIKPIVYVEGTTDIKYIKKAARLLNKNEFMAWFEITDDVIKKLENKISGDKLKDLQSLKHKRLSLEELNDSVNKLSFTKEEIEEVANYAEFINEFDLKDGNGDEMNHIWKSRRYLVENIWRKLILLYDCDKIKAPDEERKLIFQRTIPRDDNNSIKKGIENLFPPSTIKKARDYKNDMIDVTNSYNKTTRGNLDTIPRKYEICRDEKTNLCNWLCENGNRYDFRNFECIFNIIKEIIEK